MGGIENLVPVFPPPGVIELRVHGVSGTPPEALIKDQPILVAGNGASGFYRADARDTSERLATDKHGIIEGYAWGGLTSGSRLASALRLLLLPFSLANVAGWMVQGGWTPGDGRNPDDPTLKDDGPLEGTDRDVALVRVHAVFARLLALGTTVFAALGATYIANLVVAWLAGSHRWRVLEGAQWQALLPLLAVAAILIAFMRIAYRKPIEGPVGPDLEVFNRVSRSPVSAESEINSEPTFKVLVAASDGTASVFSRLWSARRVAQFFSVVHLATGLGAISALATLRTEAGLTRLDALALWCAGLAIGLGLAGVIATAFLGLYPKAWWRGARWLRWPTLFFGLVSVVLAAVSSSRLPTTAALEPADEYLRAPFSWLIGGAIALVVLQLLTAPGPFRRLGRMYSGAFMVVAYGTVFAAVSGVAVVIRRQSDHIPVSQAGAVTTAVSVVGLMSLLVVAAGLIFHLGGPTPGPPPAPAIGRHVGLRRAVRHARGLVVLGAGVFLVGISWALAQALPDHAAPEPANSDGAAALGDIGWGGLGWLAVAALLVGCTTLIARSWLPRTALALAVLAAPPVLAIAVHSWITGDAAGDSLRWLAGASDTGFVWLSIAGGLVTPVLGVWWFWLRGSKTLGVRKQVGVYWDLVNFWPRHFHPWAPAPYTDITMPDLENRIQDLAYADSRPIVVSAHSQGVIFAVPALDRLRGSAFPATNIRLLTYGNLLNVHYRHLFPWLFNPALFRRVDDYLGHNWINLHRSTDPLGYPVATLPPERDVLNAMPLASGGGTASPPRVLGHSDYQYGEEYALALRALGSTAGLSPAAAASPKSRRGRPPVARPKRPRTPSRS